MPALTKRKATQIFLVSHHAILPRTMAITVTGLRLKRCSQSADLPRRVCNHHSTSLTEATHPSISVWVSTCLRLEWKSQSNEWACHGPGSIRPSDIHCHPHPWGQTTFSWDAYTLGGRDVVPGATITLSPQAMKADWGCYMWINYFIQAQDTDTHQDEKGHIGIFIWKICRIISESPHLVRPLPPSQKKSFLKLDSS